MTENTEKKLPKTKNEDIYEKEKSTENELNKEYVAPKTLISPAGLELTKEQRVAVEKLVNWSLQAMKLSREIPVKERSIRLEGLPGSGKSTILMTLAKELSKIRKIDILATAPTHQAKRVLVEMAVENKMLDLKIGTLQSQLGSRASLDDFGEDEFVFVRHKQKIHQNDIVFADEGSMMSESQWNYMNKISDCPPLILSCDRDQLRPVQENSKSLIFREVEEAVFLTKSIRFHGAIQEYVKELRKSPVFVDPHKYRDEKNLLTVKSDKWFEMLIEKCSGEETEQKTRALAYTNQAVNWINNVVHFRKGFINLGVDINKATPEELEEAKKEVPQYKEGTKIIIKKTVNEYDSISKKRIVKVNNGTEATIKQAFKTVYNGYECWYIDFEWYDLAPNGYVIPMSHQGYCLDNLELKRFNEKYEEIRKNLAEYKNVQYSPIKQALKRDIARYRDTWLNWNKGELNALTYSYATTIHTGQGGGWEYVFPFLSDIVKCQDHAILRELIYTAMSRAKKQLIIMV